MNLVFPRLITALAVVFTPAVSATAQETTSRRPAPGVPLIRDVPALGRLFTGDGGPLYYPLEGAEGALFATRSPRDPFKEAAGHPFYRFWVRDEAASLPFRERWLRETLEKRIPELTDVHVVERTTTRYATGRPTTEVRRGLEVFGPGEALTRARAWLDRFATLRPTQVRTEFHIIRGGPRESPPVKSTQVQLLTREEYDDRLSRDRNHAGADVMGSRTILVLNGQRGTEYLLERTRYVKDYEFPIVKGAAVVVPVIAVRQDGIVIDVTPLVHAAGDRVTLDASVSVSRMRRPIREVTLTPEAVRRSIGATVPVRVPTDKLTAQLPESICARWKSDGLELSPESWLVVKGMVTQSKDDFDARATLRIYVHVKVLDRGDKESVVTGQVIGIDATARRVFIRWPEVQGSVPWGKSRLTVWRAHATGRGETTVATLPVIEHVGPVTICALPEAETGIRVGDLAKTP